MLPSPSANRLFPQAAEPLLPSLIDLLSQPVCHLWDNHWPILHSAMLAAAEQPQIALLCCLVGRGQVRDSVARIARPVDNKQRPVDQLVSWFCIRCHRVLLTQVRPRTHGHDGLHPRIISQCRAQSGGPAVALPKEYVWDGFERETKCTLPAIAGRNERLSSKCASVKTRTWNL